MTDEDQMDFHFAVQAIERRLGIQPRGCTGKLRKLCASGVVRSWKQPYSIVGSESKKKVRQNGSSRANGRAEKLTLPTDVDGYDNLVDVSKLDGASNRKGKAIPTG